MPEAAGALASAYEHHSAGRLAEAERLYRQLLTDEPDGVETLHLLGMLCHQTGRSDEAVRLLQRAVALAPDVALYRTNLAGVLGQLGRPREALEHLEYATRLRPDFAEAHTNYGVALETLGRLREAAEAHLRAIRLRPDFAEAHSNLGNVFQRLGALGTAVEAYRTAIRLNGDACAQAHTNLGLALCELGRADAAIASFRRAVELSPGSHKILSQLLFPLHYTHGDDPEVMCREHLEWARRHAAGIEPMPPPGDVDRDPDRRLRIGYVSADFRRHPVTRFVESVMAHHDRRAFEVVCYDDAANPDETTQRLRGYGDTWRDVNKLTNAELAALVRRDRVDILVDLAGHIANYRLPAFARNPAPVQVTYQGYPNTTGLSAIEYRITDSLLDPPGLTDRYHAEKLIRIDPCCWAYHPDDAPDVNELPALKSGHVTFAAMNRLSKVTPEVAGAWAQILREVPGSRLMVLAGVNGSREPLVYELFETAGVPRDRLDLVARVPRQEYMNLYGRADVALDTFPYNGHTTTCDSLFMGVPVVSMAGRTHVARMGLSINAALGLERTLVAHSLPDYVKFAIEIVKDLSQLQRLRIDLRRRFLASAWCDQVGVTTKLEAAFREMWRHYAGAEEKN